MIAGRRGRGRDDTVEEARFELAGGRARRHAFEMPVTVMRALVVSRLLYFHGFLHFLPISGIIRLWDEMTTNVFVIEY